MEAVRHDGRGVRVLAAGLVIAFVAIGITILWTFTRSDPASDAARRLGEFQCRHERGLPGAAVGKQYYIVGTEDEPYVLDGRTYHAGDTVFFGYCDANGITIH